MVSGRASSEGSAHEAVSSPDAKSGERVSCTVPLQGKLLAQRKLSVACRRIEMVGFLAEARDRARLSLTLASKLRCIPRPKRAGGLRKLCDHAAHHAIYRSVESIFLPRWRLRGQRKTQASLNQWGFLLDKPAILFGRSDFHHITGSVPREWAWTQRLRNSECGPARLCRILVSGFFQSQALNVWRPISRIRLKARLAAQWSGI